MIISDVSNINSRSTTLIRVVCDVCNIESTIKYINYTRNGNKDGEYICRGCKTKKTNLERWGVDNPSKSLTVKTKKKETTLKNWGVDNPFKSDIIKNKSRETTIERWGVDNPFKSDIIKTKIKEKNIKNLGVDNPSKSDIIKEKKRLTTLSNWGVEHPLQSNEIKEVIKANNLEKWGVQWTLQSQDIKERIKGTNIKNWGVQNPMQSPLNIERIRKSNREKWGVDWFYQSTLFKEISDISKLRRFGNTSYKKSETFYNTTIIGNDPNFIKYLGDSTSLFKCQKGHEFEIKTDNYHSRKSNISLCTICNPIGELKSIKEKELFEFITENYKGNIIQSYRAGLEIDIYLPDLKLGFEFNGLYFHSEKFKENNYHLNKTNWFKDKGIRIIHIWEDDWIYKSDILKSQIKNWLGLSIKIWARKCHIKEIKNVSKFLNENHIQGSDYSTIKLGLYFEEELVSVMTFNKTEGRKKMGEDEWNLSRFCNKLDYNIVGGASKLIKFFIKNYSVSRLISYSDRDWSLGELYTKTGFKLVSTNKPDYKYIVNGRRINKSRFRKSITGVSESKLDMLKIWDCGKLKFEKLL